MGSIDVSFKPEIFRFDQPLVIAMNRSSAVLVGVRLRYQSGGYKPGTVLAQNNVDSLYQAYSDAGASGINTANSILFEGHAAEDFNGTATTSTALAVAIFGGCVVFYDYLTGIDANGVTDLKGTKFAGADGVNLMKF